MAEERIGLGAKERERLKVLHQITSGSYRFVGRIGIDKRIRNQDDSGDLASKSLIEANLYLVVPIAEQHSPQGLSMLELIREGSLGLRHAAKSFPGNDAIFVSYAASCVEDAITKAIAESRSAS
jgi:DNA-directed RNA polymerase sigma subunit (sigma70/sigma32)